MKTAVVLSFVAAVMAGLVEKRACGGDNCARQVTGTRGGLLPLSSRQADCSSFQKATVTPDATTVTVTVTIDEADAPTPKARRDLEYRAETVFPTAIPTYASSCQGASAYSSACSCWGITAATIAAPQPTSTATVTVTENFCQDL